MAVTLELNVFVERAYVGLASNSNFVSRYTFVVAVVVTVLCMLNGPSAQWLM